MNKQDIIDHLNKGGEVEVHIWTFTESSMCCNEGSEEYGGPCCYESYSDTNEAAEDVIFYAEADLSDVELI